MFRHLISNVARSSLRNGIIKTTTAAATSRSISRIALRPAVIGNTLNAFSGYKGGVRSYSAGAGLTRELAQTRIIELLEGFDKISDPSKITLESNFRTDLGLDSLDIVEVVMFLEEEFSIDIPEYVIFTSTM